MRALIAGAFVLTCLGGATIPAPASTFGTCTFSVTNVAFGNYDPTAPAATTANGSVTLSCLLVTSITIAISAGSANSFAPRAMAPTPPATGSLAYYLYTPGGQNWGDGTASTSTYAMTSGVLYANTTATVAGSITPKQNVTAGSFNDSLTVTVNY